MPIAAGPSSAPDESPAPSNRWSCPRRRDAKRADAATRARIVNYDWRDRVVVIDPRTDRVEWQCGRTDVSSRVNGYLKPPDGLDFVPLDARGQPLWSAVRHP
jgi:hypothetical protein